MKRTNLEMLLWGVQHIAENHNFPSHIENWEDEGSVWVLGNNIPTYSDIQMLCEDVHIARECLYGDDFGIEITLTNEWLTTKGDKEFNGCCFWQRKH
jgi:hypothetical protein